MVCLGLEPGAAGWKTQTNPLSYGGTPKKVWSMPLNLLTQITQEINPRRAPSTENQQLYALIINNFIVTTSWDPHYIFHERLEYYLDYLYFFAYSFQITKPCEALSMAGMRKETIELPKPAPTPAQSQPQQPSIPPPPFPTTTPTIPKPFADSPKPGLGFSGQTPFASSTPAKPAPKPVQIGFGTPTAVKPSITPAAAPSPAAQTKPAVAKVEKVSLSRSLRERFMLPFGRFLFKKELGK